MALHTLGCLFPRKHYYYDNVMMVGFLSVDRLALSLYFWIGMLSTKTIQIICPAVITPTKIARPCRACMHCNNL
ncbi:hypothetical protein CW304_23225 [Bacillus sp. UFRGS-B20]|nr:hypothetical protein CW304_23225 [Bacillus sp. UFRGS-B20]